MCTFNTYTLLPAAFAHIHAMLAENLKPGFNQARYAAHVAAEMVDRADDVGFPHYEIPARDTWHGRPVVVDASPSMYAAEVVVVSKKP